MAFAAERAALAARGSRESAMKYVYMLIGVLVVGLGTVWTLQGLDLLGQTGGMNGVKIFSYIGPVVAVVGLVLIVVGFRAKGRTKA